MTECVRELPHGEAALFDGIIEALDDCLDVLIHHDRKFTKVLTDLTTPETEKHDGPTGPPCFS